MTYARAADLIPDIARVIAPRARRPVSASARAVVRVQSASGAVMPWAPDITPYMVEPMDLLESRQYQALVFIGPAQSGKTQALIDCWLGHVATNDPSDMMIVQATQSVARDFERDRWRRLRRQSPEIAAAIASGGHNDNTFDKLLISGDIVYLKWPSENELQGKSIRRMALTDYDRMPLSIGGQGSPFDLARKRTRKFRSLAMTLAESSPGYEQSDPHWRPSSPHEAPPAKGIFSLYNLGDRRRLYWPCPHCGEFHLTAPGPDALHYEIDTDLVGGPILATLGPVRIACRHCAALIDERERPAMLAAARWVPDDCTIARDGTITGTPPATDIASYWLHGIHAAFQSWRGLALSYLQAKTVFDATGDEEGLRTVTMQDFGAPFVSAARSAAAAPAELQSRSEEYTPRAVPPAARYLVCVVDVQAWYFSVAIIAHGPHRERWLIDRFEIHESPRAHLDGINPAAYAEDWEPLTERCVLATYPLAEDPARRMNIRLTLVDTGGRGSKYDPAQTVTRRAYEWFRALRRRHLDHRVALIKGVYRRPDTPGRTVTESRPDNTARADRHADARGDVPLYLLHVNALKDSLAADLKRAEPGPGYIHLPRWLPPSIFDELAAEVRTAAGWEPAGHQRRNELWDQLTYDLAADLIPQHARGIIRLSHPAAKQAQLADRIDWTNPPPWAAPLDRNSEVNQPLDAQPAAGADPAAWRKYDVL